MNAVTPTRFLLPQSAAITGQLIHSGYAHTDSLYLDLYGAHDDEERRWYVEGVTACGSQVDLTELFSAKQLDNLGLWLSFKDDTNPGTRDYANTKRYEAQRA